MNCSSCPTFAGKRNFCPVCSGDLKSLHIPFEKSDTPKKKPANENSNKNTQYLSTVVNAPYTNVYGEGYNLSVHTNVKTFLEIENQWDFFLKQIAKYKYSGTCADLNNYMWGKKCDKPMQELINKYAKEFND